MRSSFIAALLCCFPCVASAQVLSAAQDAWVKAFAQQLGREVERCSLDANVGDRPGPATVELQIDERARLKKLTVLDALRKTDVGKCIAAFRPAQPLPAARFAGGKTIRLEVPFHPWASKSKRTWAQVRKVLHESKAEPALWKCVQAVGKDRPRDVTFTMDITLAGSVALASEADPCFASVVQALQFGPSENHFRVEYAWRTTSKPRVARGFTFAPQDCEVEAYPCSWAEADPGRVNLGNEYLKKLGERINCADPSSAVAWLEKQPHVRWVRVDGCHVSMLVDGARPMSYFGP